MDEIKKVGKSSLAKTFSLIYGLVGFLFTLSMGISSVIDVFLEQGKNEFTVKVAMRILAALIVSFGIALGLAIFGWLMGYIIAAIYNIFSPKMGGIEIEIGNKNKNIQEIFNDLPPTDDSIGEADDPDADLEETGSENTITTEVDEKAREWINNDKK
jgi:hypothetical protein